MKEKEIIKKYKNDDITVIWKPNSCIHSKKCWKGLIQVFNPQNRPWIDMNGASTVRIKKQVDACPSGALTYETHGKTSGLQDAESTKVQIELIENGPMIVHGVFQLKDTKGNTKKHDKKTALCRCGASENKPLCDGSHIKVDFKAN